MPPFPFPSAFDLDHCLILEDCLGFVPGFYPAQIRKLQPVFAPHVLYDVSQNITCNVCSFVSFCPFPFRTVEGKGKALCSASFIIYYWDCPGSQKERGTCKALYLSKIRPETLHVMFFLAGHRDEMSFFFSHFDGSIIPYFPLVCNEYFYLFWFLFFLFFNLYNSRIIAIF